MPTHPIIDEVLFGLNPEDLDDDSFGFSDLAQELREDGPMVSATSLLDDDDLFGAMEDEEEGSWSSLDLPSDPVPLCPSVVPGRVAMGSRVRRLQSGTAAPEDAHAVSWYGGYLQCATDSGVLSQEQLAENYGGVVKLAGKGIGKLFRLAGAAGRGALGAPEGSTAEERAQKLGQGFQESLGIKRPGAQEIGKALGSWLRGGKDDGGEEEDAEVVADATTLPPTYVADDEGAEHAVAQQEQEPDESAPMAPVDTFGASFSAGCLARQPRDGARGAVKAAASFGLVRMRRAARRPFSSMVHDTHARPYLLSSGVVREPVYGRMAMVPCPSCARVRVEAFGRNGCSCPLCEGHGAILMPDSDVDGYRSSYGFLLLGLLGSAAAGAAGKAFSDGQIFPELREEVGEKLADSGIGDKVLVKKKGT